MLLDRPAFKRLSSQRYPLSVNEAAALCEKYELGRATGVRALGGNFTNSVFECTVSDGTRLVLKIQHREGSQPLSADKAVTKHLQGVLPVSPICILDTDRDVISHPTLILSCLEGAVATEVFEESPLEHRMAVSKILGRVLGTIHSASTPAAVLPKKPLFSLNGFREKVKGGLLGDVGLRSAIESIPGGFLPKISTTIEEVPDLEFEEESRLVWGDPKFHNFLLKEAGTEVELSGVFDFQTAGLGNPIFDALYLEGNFSRSQREGIYQDPDNADACWEGYRETGKTIPAISETERRVRGAILKANGPRWWWDAAKVLPPFTQRTLQELLEDLEWLRDNAA